MPESPPAPDGKPTVHPLTRAAWRSWLAKHHLRPDGVWVITFKKAARKPTLSYDELVEEALCFGWVDSKSRGLDDERSLLWFAPRRPKSNWVRSNKERVERLTAAGSMRPAGLAKVEAAKADGSWEKLDAVERLEVPPDLAAELKMYAEAARHFDAFPRSVKRGILEWIVQAKKPETRAKRVEETARLAAVNERANQRPK